MEDERWRAVARCRDEESVTWFPHDSMGVEIAKAICAECPVQDHCLDYALRNGLDHGVWGGASERERRGIRRRLRLAKPRGPVTRGRVA